MNRLKSKSLPSSLRRELKTARMTRGWSQAELGRRAGLPQAHVSGIETAKIIPRFDTLLELVRILGRDLVLVPRALVPAVNTLVREERDGRDSEQPLYADDDDEDDMSVLDEL